jgi:hypothetical protein
MPHPRQSSERRRPSPARQASAHHLPTTIRA